MEKKRGGCLKFFLITFASTLITLASVAILFMIIATLGGNESDNIKTGQSNTVNDVSVSRINGTITISGDSQISGMSVLDPELINNNKLQYTFKTTEIKKHSLGRDFNPITPLITIDNGHGFSDEIISISIPIKRAQGKFPMAFYYDRKTGKLEGIPTLKLTESNIVIGTSHFSDIVVTEVDVETLENISVDTGYRPGKDDWQFVNYGSAAAPGGHCAGQSISSIWYYSEIHKKGGEVSLYGRFDNNLKTKTSDFWIDDSLGYRLASVVQEKMDWDNDAAHKYSYFTEAEEYLTYYCFAYSMKLTGDPQLVCVYTVDGKSGHALVAYKISDNKIYIADPNYPGAADRYISYFNGQLSSYNSGANATEIDAGNSTDYTNIYYYGSTSLVNNKRMDEFYREFQNGTIGNDIFPTVKIQYTTGEKLHDLTEIIRANERDDVTFSIFSSADRARVSMTMGIEGINWILVDKEFSKDEGISLTLPIDIYSGDIGIFIEAFVDGGWYYVNFIRTAILTSEPVIESSEQTVLSDEGNNNYDKIKGVYNKILTDHEMTTYEYIILEIQTDGIFAVTAKYKHNDRISKSSGTFYYNNNLLFMIDRGYIPVFELSGNTLTSKYKCYSTLRLLEAGEYTLEDWDEEVIIYEKRDLSHFGR